MNSALVWREAVLPVPLPQLHFQGGVKGKRAMTVILKAMAFGTSGGKRQDGIEPVQRLDGGLLVDAEHGGVLRWIQVQTDDIGGLGLELRSLLAMERSSRCGFSCACVHTRCTVDLLMPVT